MAIQYFKFKSERVVQGWYDDRIKEITLQFPDGTKWWYRNCTQKTWNNLKKAESAGKFIANILDSYRNGPV